MKNSLKIALAGGLLLAMAGRTANADTFTFDFEGLVQTQYNPLVYQVFNAAHDHFLTATFTPTGTGTGLNVTPNDVGAAGRFGDAPITGNVLDVSTVSAQSTGVSVTFDAPVTFFGGVDFAGAPDDSGVTTVSDSLGDTTTLQSPTPTSGTLGFFQGTLPGEVGPFTTITFSTSGTFGNLNANFPEFVLDNLSVTSAGTLAVPEPGAMALLAAGLLPVAWKIRRRKLDKARAR